MSILYNDSSGLTGLFSRLTNQLDAAGANNDTTASLAANGVIPQSYAPPQGILARILGLSGNAQPGQGSQQPVPMGSPQPAAQQPPAPMTPASPAPPITMPRAVPQPQAQAMPQPQQAVQGLSLGTPGLPAIAAIQGRPTSGGLGNMFSALESKFNLPTGYLAGTAGIEDPSGDPNATSPTGAKGLFQFTKGTASQYGLSNPSDVVASSYAAAKLAADNAQSLASALGRQPTAGELYLAHQQGAKGAAALIANPDVPAGQVLASIGVSPRNIAVNGGDPNAPAAAFTSKWTSRFGTGVPDGAGPTQVAQAQGGALGPAGLGMRAAQASPYGAPTPASAFGGLPTMAQGGQGSPSPSTMAFSAPQGARAVMQAQQQPQTPQGDQNDAQAYAPDAPSVPAQQAIAAATGQPYGSLPLSVGNKVLTRQQAEDTDGYDHTDYDAAAAKAGLIASPGAAPVFADGAAPVSAPAIAAQQAQFQPASQAQPNGAAGASAAPQAPAARTVNGLNLRQIQGLLANPSTRQLGQQLWGQYYQQPALTKAQAGDYFLDGSGKVVTAIPDKPAFQHFQGKDGSEYAFDPRSAKTSVLSDGGPGTTTLQPSQYSQYGVDPSYKGPVQVDSDGNLKFPAPAGAAARPELVDVPQADGTVQKQFITPGQAQGVPVGAPYSPSKNAGIMGPTEQKIFNDHYDKVEALGQGLQALKDARALSDQTPTGLAASGERVANYATMGHAFADNVANADTYDAKIKLASTALMRAAIGGRVTNYDEKIAQDIAPTSAKSIGARDKILDDQIAQKERDYASAQATVEAMRNGSYFAKGPNAQKLPGQSPMSYTPAASASDAILQARAAIAAGADMNAVKQRLQQHGIDPGGL